MSRVLVLRPARALIGAACALVPSLQAQINSPLAVQPQGALASGTTSVTRVGSQYHFKYSGSDEVIDYVIDVGDASVRKGVIRVYEAQSGSYPIAAGGLAWRTDEIVSQSSGYVSPTTMANASPAPVMYGEDFDAAAGRLTLRYRETPSGASGPVGRKAYVFWIVGKVLKVRAHAEATAGTADFNDRLLGNYGFLYVGSSAQTPLPAWPARTEQYVPYMDNVSLVRFQPTAGVDRFFAVYADPYASNGVLLQSPFTSSSASAFERFYPMLSARSSASATNPYKILAQVDETLNVIVTAKHADTFPAQPHYRSPHYGITAGRMSVFSPQLSPGAWSRYTSQYERFADLGMTDLTVLHYRGFTWGDLMLTPDFQGACPIGCDAATLDAIWQANGQQVDAAGVRLIDPRSAAALAAVANVWGTAGGNIGVAPAVRRLGALFSSSVVHDITDQWGFSSSGCGQGCQQNYPASSASCAVAGNNFYPTQLGWRLPIWSASGSSYGLAFPVFGAQANPLYNDAYTVRDHTGTVTPGWDVASLFCGTSWNGYGYKLATVDATGIPSHLMAQLSFGKANYGASAILYDASGTWPSSYRIDQIAGSSRSHTTREVMLRSAAAVRSVKDDFGGPMYGETNYWRWGTIYEYGARDGFRSAFAPIDSFTGGGSLLNADGPVIPDYMLTQVLPKAAGNSAPEEHHHTPASVPYDGDVGTGGDDNAFIDSYITTSATYGLNPFAASNGDKLGTQWTYQGLLRQYYALTPVARRVREGKVQSITYYSGAQAYDLGQAIAAGIDLVHPRVMITFDNGLVIAANHDGLPGSTWNVSIPKLSGGIESIDVSPNGFAAGDGNQVFVFFNAKPVGHASPLPFDYANYKDRWVMLNDRRTATTGANVTVYEGFPSSTLQAAFSPAELDLFAEGLIVRNHVVNRAIGAVGGKWNELTGQWAIGLVSAVPFGVQPIDTTLAIQPDLGATKIYTHKPAGFVARHMLTATTWQDVSTLATWTATCTAASPSEVTIRNGVLKITPSGPVPPGTTATVTAAYVKPPYNVQTVFTIDVESGLPIAEAGPNQIVQPGRAVTFDATTSRDPVGGAVKCVWTFGDGASAEGRVVRHVYRTPQATPYTVTLTVTDIHGFTSQDTATVTVGGSGMLWGHSFDDGTLLGMQEVGTSLFGPTQNAVAQSYTSSGVRCLNVTGQAWARVSTGAEVRLTGTGSAARVGIATWMPNQTSVPANGGFNAYVDGASNLVLRKGSAVLSTQVLPSLDLTRRHDLRIVTSQSGSSTRVRVYVDGVKKHDATSSNIPTVNGYTGVFSESAAGLADDLRVANNTAPYLAVFPSDLVTATATKPTIYIDDQNLFGNIDQTSLTLTLRVLDGPSAGASESYVGASNVLTQMSPASFSYETGNASTSTWASMKLARSIEYYLDVRWPGANALALELSVVDAGGQVAKKVVEFRR